MDFDSINMDTSTEQATVWAFDHIRDALPDGAPDWKVHQAFAAEYNAKLDTYVSRTHLIRSWFGNTSALREIAEVNPEIFLDILHHFEAALERCTTPSVATSH